ncbi:MAG: hypothetical protein WA755_11575 [Candidatus Acidiferrales bacterium]
MVTILILVISAAAFAQFAVFSWRAAFLTIAAQPVSDETRAALSLPGSSLETADFQGATQWLALSPSLSGTDLSVWPVRLYYAALRGLGSLTGLFTASGADWSQREMEACAQYVTVVMDERLRRNRACMAEICSY